MVPNSTINSEVENMNIKTELLKNRIIDIIKSNMNDFEIDADEIADTEAIRILSEIQLIIMNESYSDFEIVEKIVSLFEENNIDYGTCHDFG